MAKTKIFLCTWNMGEKGGKGKGTTGQSSAEILAKKGIASGADIVILGTQETKGFAGFLKAFGSKLSGYMDANDRIHQINNTKGVLKARVAIRGITKAPQIFTGGCSQRLGVWVRTGSTKIQAIKVGVETLGGLKSIPSEKGAMLTVLTIDGAKVGCVSTHLNAGSNTGTKRRDELMRYLTALEKMNDDNKLNGVFVMGDLNFRVINQQMDDLLKLPFDLADPVKRGQLYDATDGLDNDPSSQLGSVNGYNFTYPVVKSGMVLGQIALPTYKRICDPITVTKAYTASDPLEKVNAIIDAYGLGTLKKVKKTGHGFDKGDFIAKVWNVKRETFDIGWLDRIGYATGPAFPNAVQFQPKWTIDIPQVTEGDHVPVGMLIDIVT